VSPDVVATVAWLTLLAVGAIWEVVCHLSGGRWSSLTGIGAWLWTRPPGRIVLIAVWAFVGWHVFARYTLPGSTMKTQPRSHPRLCCLLRQVVTSHLRSSGAGECKPAVWNGSA
jgi:hypothetical protein